MLLPARGAVTGWAALRLAGAAYFDGLLPDGATRRPVRLLAGPGQARRDRAGVVWSQGRFPDEEVWRLAGVACTRPLRALFDEMRTAVDVRAAVVDLDMAAAAELSSIRRMREYVGRQTGCGGVPLVRRALDLADENSRSPAESRLRLTWELDCARPRPLTNRDVLDQHGRLLGIADLIDPVAGVVGEYDGVEHARAGRRSRDAAKDTAFRDHGLEVFRVTGYDEHRPGAVRARIESAYARAEVNGMPRLWTIEPPPGWPVPPTLDDHLETQDVLRQLHRAIS